MVAYVTGIVPGEIEIAVQVRFTCVGASVRAA